MKQSGVSSRQLAVRNVITPAQAGVQIDSRFRGNDLFGRVLRPLYFVLLLATCHLSLDTVLHAQFATQATVPVPFSVSAPASTVTYISIPNRGQIAHTVQVVYTPASPNCTVWLQGSMDNSSWITLAAIPNINGNSRTQLGSATGYFTYLRVAVNANAKPGCTSKIDGFYTGLSTPVSFSGQIYNIPMSVQAPATMTAKIEYPAPQILMGLSCFNPNNTVSSGTVVFTGGGLNDLSKSGTYSCPGGRNYRVQVDGTGIPDTFRWSNNAGASYQATDVAMTGAPQLLECGLSVTFGATTGHTLTNFWTFNATDGTAYLQIADRNPPPAALGSFILYQLAILPGQAVSENVPFYSGNALSAAASTTQSGLVAVADPLPCNFQINLNGPFGPFLGAPNRL